MMSDVVSLKPGTILADDYRIERTLGAGGFGITYLAEEMPLARLVTIKEYFPLDFAARDSAEDVVPRSRECEGDYAWGLDRFLAEAQTLAKFTHPNIVRVYRYFLARNTGYIVLHYEEGASLKGWLKSLGRAPRQPELDRILEPLLGALETVHAADYLHRDIAPDNIMIRRDGSPVLIDFGSARGDIAKHSKTISALVKPGYSPYEQYATTSRQQGPWTDIYSMGATLYEAVAGRRPPDAPSRMVADEMIPPADAALSSYRPKFLAAIAKSLRLEINERPRSVADWRAELLARPATSAPEPEPKKAGRREVKPHVERGAGGAPAPVPDAKSAGEVRPRTLAAALDAAVIAERPVGAPASGDGAARGGIAAAFLEGWRKAAPSEASLGAPVAAKPFAAAMPEAQHPPVVPVAVPAKRRDPSAASDAAEPHRPRLLARFGFVQAAPAIANPDAGSRKASPRAIRKSSRSLWRGVALKLGVALGIAGAVVALQDHVPTVRREGAGQLTSQTGVDVPLGSLKGHRGVVSGLAFSGDGQHLVAASADGTIRIWDAARGTLVRTIELDNGPARAFAISKGRVATGHRDGTVAVWGLETGSKVATFRRNDAAITGVAFAGRADRVAASASDGTAVVWETAQPAAPVQVFEGHSGAAKAIAFASRGSLVAIASGAADQTVKLWHLDKGELVRTYRGHEAPVAALAFEPEGRTLASASTDGQIRLWSTYANRLKRRLKGHEAGVAALVFAPDGTHLVSGGEDGTLRIWDITKGRTVRTIKAGMGAITAVGLSADGRRIAIAGADGMVRVFETGLSKDGS